MRFKFTNKKYAIRKLTMGVASIAIGTIAWGAGGFLVPSVTQNTHIAYAACNPRNYYFLNHYDEYETVYEADGTLAKGEHKIARDVNEGRQLFDIRQNQCVTEPFTALGDDELYHKPYEVITDKSNLAKESWLKYTENLKKNNVSEEDNKESDRLYDKYINSLGEFFFETRTRKKVLLNKDENVTEPIYNSDGTAIIPSHSISKKYKNYKDQFVEFSLFEIDENYLNSNEPYHDYTTDRDKYNKYVKDSFKLVKVGNVERIPISTTAIETDYVANHTLDYGVRNTTNQGKEGLRENVVTYEVDRNTGDLKNPTTVENTIPMEKKIVEVGTKEKVVYSKKGNDVIKTTTTYELNTTTGEVTPKSTESIYNAGGVTPKEIVEEIPKPIKYIADENLHYGERNVEQAGENGKKVTTTTYEVNPENGELIEHTNEPVITQPTEQIVKVGTQKRWQTKRENDDWVFNSTEYSLNEKTGEVSITKGEDRKQNYFKPKITETQEGNKTIKTTTVAVAFPKENYDSYAINMPPVFTEVTTEETIETIPSVKKYVKDDTKNLGEENITFVQGKNGTKTIVKTYHFGISKWILEEMPDEIKNNPIFYDGIETSEPVITEATDTIVKVAAKDKVEYLKVGNDVVKRTTTYKVNPENGEITSEVKDEIVKTGEVKDKVEYLKVGNYVIKRTTTYKVNPENGEITSEVKDEVFKTEQPKVEHSKGTELPLKQDELPELKVAIIKDKDNNILDVIKENEEPKHIQGYMNTNKSEIDNEGHKVYIYEKIVETSKGTENPPVVSLPEFTGGVNSTDAPVVEELPELKVDVRDNNTDKKTNNIQDNNTVNNKEPQDKTITNKEEDKVVETNKEPVENNKQTIIKKEDLPKTSASFFSGLGLLAGFGLIIRKKEK